MTETCLFCEDEITDQGLGFYDHVEARPDCNYLWSHWKTEIPNDHGGD